MGADRQTDRQTHDETNSRFRNSANGIKIIMNGEKLTTFMEVILEQFKDVSRPFVLD